MNMTTKDFDKLGAECVNHLTALNPKGGVKTFIRIAVEFGYQRAVKNLTIQNVRKRAYSKWFERVKCVGFFALGFFIAAIIFSMFFYVDNKMVEVKNQNNYPNKPQQDELGFWKTYITDGKMFIDKSDICFPCGDSKKNIIDSTEHYYVFRLDN